MTQQRLSDFFCDQRLVMAVEEIIEKGSCAVSKPVRAGFTTSCVLACEKKGQRLLVLAPTRRILKETVSKASIDAVRVPGNSECPLIKEDLKKNPILAQLPLTLPNCEKCNASEWCEVRTILREKDPSVIGLTYAKLEALMLSKGKAAKEILTKLSRVDVILLDEAHLLALPSIVSVRAFASLMIPQKYKTLDKVYQMWLEFCQSHVELIQELMEKAEQGHAGQYLARNVSNINILTWKELKMAWPQLRKLAVEHELEDGEVLQLRDIISIMSSAAVSIGYISEDEGESGGVYVSAGHVKRYRVLNEFLTNYAHHAKLLFVSGTLFEPHPGHFSELAGKEIENVVFPDLRGATKKLTLIPDRWTLTSRNFAEKLPLVLDTIKAIAEREKQSIYLLAPNSRKAVILMEERKDAGLKDIFVDYYRSDRSLGVERSERVCITLGRAEIPANACDALARGKDLEERWLDSRKLRNQAVDTATWQAVNRVRDPAGQVESRVYFIGCKLDHVRQTATWGTDRQLILREIRRVKGSDGKDINTPIFDVKVAQEIELPKIYSAETNKDHSERRLVKDLIEEIELYNGWSINSENHSISSIHINRENGVKLGIYNFPKKEIELDSTSAALYSMYVTRTDNYAVQFQNSKTGKWEFSKVRGELNEKRIRQHIRGEFTTGVYEIALDDTVNWCCDDIDTHNGETDAREKVARLVSTCRFNNVPFLLEASGSMDSYHLWIFLSKTSTYNAYRFIRQINSESEVDCEAWPKQKKLDKNSKFGNLVKLPVCYHNRSESRSAFIDADTFEPLDGPIYHPGLVHLLEIPDLSESKSEGMPRIVEKRTARRNTRTDNHLDYCMQRALEEKISLEGSEGHHLRLAIAIKANNIGMDAETTAQLFQCQADYNHDLSVNKVLETWSYNYSPWSCEALRDKCGRLVKSYCLSCPFNFSDGVKGEA